MSKSNTDPIQGSGSIADSVNQFVESVSSALSETEASEDVLTEVEETGKALAEDVDELEQSVTEQGEEIDDYQERNELDKASMKQRISSVETGTGDDNPGGDRSETSLFRPESPLENVVSLPETMVDELTANQERARFIARDVSQYATKVPAGRSLDYSTIKTVLAARGDIPHGQTVIRVMDFLDRLGKNGTKDVERRGKRRIVFTEEAVERLERLSQAGTPGKGEGDTLSLPG